MEAKEFISIGLHSGDRVRVTIAGRTYKGYFGGYKMFDGINDIDNYSIFPVFYATGKAGQMVKRSLVPGRTSWWGLSDIASCEKITVPYRHVGYYNNPEDCVNLAKKGFTAALEVWKKAAALYARQIIGEIAGGKEGFNITPLNRDCPFVKIRYRGESVAVEEFTADGKVWAAGEPFDLTYHLSDDDAVHVVESLEILKIDLKAGRLVKDAADDGLFLRYTEKKN